MNTLIVYESLFGNTARIAEAIADGIRRTTGSVEVVATDAAPDQVPDNVGLLVLGGPTHAFGMTRTSTRADATKQGASQSVGRGMREWIDQAEPRANLPIVTFDTRVKVPFLPGSAAKSAVKALRGRGFEHAERGETFWVEGKDGPLKPGEIERAAEWGASLSRLATRVG